ncbi:MAG: DUF2460 domain-containing protein [Gemmatimonadales bacterium]
MYIREYIRACEAFGWEGGPEFNTSIVPMANKREKRNANWSQSRFFATLPFLNIRPDIYQYIIDMFEDRMGRWGAFLYRNPFEHVAVDQEFATAESGQTTFQLSIYVGQPGRKRKRDIHALYIPEIASDGDAVESEITIEIDGTPTTAFVIDHDRGIVEFDSPPGAGAVLTWSGPYSYWVRFDQDRLPMSIDNKSGEDFMINGSVDLLGVPPPRLPDSSGS